MIQPARVLHPTLRASRPSGSPPIKASFTLPAPTLLLPTVHHASERYPHPLAPRGTGRDVTAATLATVLALGGVTAGVGVWASGFTVLLHGAAAIDPNRPQVCSSFPHNPSMASLACNGQGVLAIAIGCALLLYSAKIASQNGALLVDALALGLTRLRGQAQTFDRYAESLLRRANNTHEVKARRLEAIPMFKLLGLGAAGECMGLSYGMTAVLALQILTIEKAYLAATAIGYANLKRLLDAPLPTSQHG